MAIQFNSAVPQFTVPDVVKASEYYRDVLGFGIDGYWHDPPVFAIVRRDQVQVFFSLANHPEVRTGRAHGAYDAYFRISGVESLAAELKSRGADIIDGPDVRVYGQRELVIRDCNGLILAFGEPA